MRKMFAVLAAIGILVGSAVATQAAAGGPPCTDVTDGEGTYNWANDVNSSTTGDLSFTVTLDAPSCSNVTYTLTVLESWADRTEITTPISLPGNGASTLTYDASVDDDHKLCVYSTTTQNASGRQIDRAPDAGCLELVAYPYSNADPASGGQGYN